MSQKFITRTSDVSACTYCAMEEEKTTTASIPFSRMSLRISAAKPALRNVRATTVFPVSRALTSRSSGGTAPALDGGRFGPIGKLGDVFPFQFRLEQRGDVDLMGAGR